MQILTILSINNSIADLKKLCRNAFLKNIFKCEYRPGKLKVNFVSRDQALGSASKRFMIVFPAGTVYVKCHS